MLDHEIAAGMDQVEGPLRPSLRWAAVKGRRRRVLFVASLAATAIAGLAAGTVPAFTDAETGGSVAADLLWTAGGFLLVAFVVTIEGKARRLLRRRGA
jgi:peptidoglycan/LPS O-acetylase OafA/YrhL